MLRVPSQSSVSQVGEEAIESHLSSYDVSLLSFFHSLMLWRAYLPSQGVLFTWGLVCPPTPGDACLTLNLVCCPTVNGQEREDGHFWGEDR